MKKTILLNLVVLLVTAASGPAGTRLVPDEYATIQDAIDAAVDGDVVIVAPATYTGDGNRDIDFYGKAITVRSENGPANCIIDCQSSGRGFYFRNEDENSIVDWRNYFNFWIWIRYLWMVIPPYPILLTLIPGVLLLLLKPLGKIFKISYLQEESFGGLLGEGSIEAFDTVLSVVTNVASYTRLLALALAHIALLTSINAMMGLIQGEGIGVEIVNLIGGIFGNMIVILLEGLLVFINCVRLHFYEFFFKFYQGSGIEYFPFYLDTDYSIMKFSGKIERDIISEEIEREIDTKLVKEEINKALSYISKKFDYK